MTELVDKSECETMRSLYDDEAMTMTQLADEVGRSRSCISRHTGRRCRHEDMSGTIVETVDDVVDVVTDFAESLDPPRLPSQTEWNNQENKPCSSKRLKTVVGCRSWSGVIETCGYPEMPRNTSRTFRITLYESPEIMEVRR